MGIFGEFEIDEDSMIKSKDVIGLFVAQKEEEKKEEEKAPEPEPEAEPEEDAGAAKKSFYLSTLPSSRGYLRTTCHQEEGDSAFWSPQKNYRIVPERWINIFCIRMSVFPLPSVWTSGAPL